MSSPVFSEDPYFTGFFSVHQSLATDVAEVVRYCHRQSLRSFKDSLFSSLRLSVFLHLPTKPAFHKEAVRQFPGKRSFDHYPNVLRTRAAAVGGGCLVVCMAMHVGVVKEGSGHQRDGVSSVGLA